MAMIKCPECKKEISDKAKTCPGCGLENPAESSPPQKKKKSGILVWLVLAVSVYFAMQGLSKGGDVVKRDMAMADAAAAAKSAAGSKLKFDYEWSKGGFDSIMMLNLIFDNQSDSTIKDIEISCRSFGGSGTEIDKNDRVIFETIPPHSKRRFDKFNMGFLHSQVQKTNCVLKDFKLD